jgi:membrane-bound lytic murein transglycosylase B
MWKLTFLFLETMAYEQKKIRKLGVCAALVALVSVTGCASSSSSQASGGIPKGYQPSAPERTARVAVNPTEAVLARSEALESWLQGVKAEAATRGVSDYTWDAAMTGFQPIPKIIALDRKQPEGTHTLTQYLAKVINNQRIANGRKLYQENKKLLDQVAQEYHVPAHYIVALWGIETSYGTVTGGFSVPRALATLAHDGRRADYFREELIKSLLIIEQGHISAQDMKGSWAGAMGQSQFMPSAFMDFAVDENGDGHKDIWQTKADVFASIANYLSKSGWIEGAPWGHKVRLPVSFDMKLADVKQFKPIQFWVKQGITEADGKPLTLKGDKYAVMLAGKPEEGVYLITPNTSVLLKWNRSRYFATAVGTLADAIRQ